MKAPEVSEDIVTVTVPSYIPLSGSNRVSRTLSARLAEASVSTKKDRRNCMSIRCPLANYSPNQIETRKTRASGRLIQKEILRRPQRVFQRLVLGAVFHGAKILSHQSPNQTKLFEGVSPLDTAKRNWLCRVIYIPKYRCKWPCESVKRKLGRRFANWPPRKVAGATLCSRIFVDTVGATKTTFGVFLEKRKLKTGESTRGSCRPTPRTQNQLRRTRRNSPI